MACVVSKERGFPAEINWLNYVNMVSFYEAIEPRFQSVQTYDYYGVDTGDHVGVPWLVSSVLTMRGATLQTYGVYGNTPLPVQQQFSLIFLDFCAPQ